MKLLRVHSVPSLTKLVKTLKSVVPSDGPWGLLLAGLCTTDHIHGAFMSSNFPLAVHWSSPYLTSLTAWVLWWIDTKVKANSFPFSTKMVMLSYKWIRLIRHDLPSHLSCPSHDQKLLSGGFASGPEGLRWVFSSKCRKTLKTFQTEN